MNYKKVVSYYTQEENAPALYGLLNELFYHGSLPEITLRYRGLKQPNDHHSIQVNGEFMRKDPETGSPSITLDPSILQVSLLSDTWKRQFFRLCGDMLHEMAHYYCYLNQIVETDGRGVYHNTAFRNVAANHGLSVGLNMKHPELDGYNSTTCTLAAEQRIQNRIKQKRRDLK